MRRRKRSAEYRARRFILKTSRRQRRADKRFGQPHYGHSLMTSLNDQACNEAEARERAFGQ